MEASEDDRTRPALPPAERWWANAWMVTFAFRCNAACTFCMVEDALNVFEGTSLSDFVTAAKRAEHGGVERIVFSGGEVTLSKELGAYVAAARAIPSVKHVRVQTNAIALADEDALRALLDAGVDEFFVSLHAADGKTCDAITRTPGSFDSIRRGLSNIAKSGASLTTNTAIVRSNHDQLPAIVELAASYGPQSIEMWSYWPRGDEHGSRGHLVPIAEVRPHLLRALKLSVELGIAPVVKWFPRCLLGRYAMYLDDGQPPALIENDYWAREPHYACIYEGVCEHAGRDCSGLSFPYIERLGWEHRLLSPKRGAAAVGPNGESVLSRSLVKDGAHRTESAIANAWLGEFELAEGAVLEGFSLTKAGLGRGAPMIALAFEREGRGVHVQVHPGGSTSACFLRTPSYDILYSRARGTRAPEVEALVREVGRRISARDAGGRTLPGVARR